MSIHDLYDKSVSYDTISGLAVEKPYLKT